MADAARQWQILTTLQTRLQGITVAGGYRTNVGADVRLEEAQFLAGDPDRVNLYAGNTVRPDDARSKGERAFNVIVEVYVSTSHDDAQARVVAAAEDIEDILDAYLPQPAALPLSFEECIYLDGPAGVEALVAQITFATRYRRDRA